MTSGVDAEPLLGAARRKPESGHHLVERHEPTRAAHDPTEMLEVSGRGLDEPARAGNDLAERPRETVAELGDRRLERGGIVPGDTRSAATAPDGTPAETGCGLRRPAVAATGSAQPW